MADNLDDAEAEALAGLAEDGMPEPEAPGDALFDTSHDGLALDMGRLWTDARHVASWGRWLFWSGAAWIPDESLLHMTRTRTYLRDKGDELVRWAQAEGDDKKLAACEAIAKTLRSAPMVAHVVGLARSNPDQVATVAQWDRDPYLLGTPAGTVDLRTGELRQPSPDDYITKLTAVAPAAAGTPCPLWTRTLARIFRHDASIIPFLQRALGYALTGECKEHVLFFAWGMGGNGKGVVLNAASGMLGDYAAVAPQDMLLVTQSDRHPCDMAMLRGARFVTAQELAPGRAWDEPKMKSLTGGDPVTARFMRQDFFTFQPQFTLFVAGNHKPAFKGVDQAIRRRVLLLPFLQNIPAEERDPALPEKLKAEWPAILRWMIDGCLAWQRQGLDPPASVRAATDDYLNAEDVLGQWLDERCIVSPRIDWTSLTSLYGAWKLWCDDRGQHPGTSTALSKKLDERGFRREKRKTGAGFCGIGLAETASGDGNDTSAHIDRIWNFPRAGAHTHANADYGENCHFRHPADADGAEIDL